MDGPEPGPMDLFAAGYLIWACFLSTSPAMNPALPIPRSTPITLSPPPDRPEESCEEEWERAYAICEREIGGDNKGITGGYTDLYSCARGLVSQRCGGNKVVW